MVTATALAFAALVFLLAALALRQRAVEINRARESDWQENSGARSGSWPVFLPLNTGASQAAQVRPEATDRVLEVARMMAERRAWEVARDLAEQKTRAISTDR